MKRNKIKYIKMEDNYISNIGSESDTSDLELYEQIDNLQKEKGKLEKEIKTLRRENLTQKHNIQDLEINMDHLKEQVKNQTNLIKFYKDNKDNNKSKESDEKIKSLEESILIKDKKIEELTKELKEQSSLNEKLVDVITNKEEIIKKLEKGTNINNGLDNEDNLKIRIEKFEEEIENLKEKISDLESEKEKIIDKYEDKIALINKENNDYQDKIYDCENEILNLKEVNKKYEIEEVRQKGGPDTEGEIDKLYKEEIENLKNALKEEKDSKKYIKEKAQEQRNSDVKEILDLEKINDNLKNELNDLKISKDIIENEKKNIENLYEKLIKKNKELENIYSDKTDNELILNKFQSKLEKKNLEIENLTSKCKEFKDNLDQYEKEKEEREKEFKHEKDVLLSEVNDKSKRLEVVLRELNEIRTKEGKSEANVDSLIEDPKQKLYDEIKVIKKEILEKNKEINDLKIKLDHFEIDRKNELEAQTEYLNSMIESYKKNIEVLKEQKIKDEKDFENQIENLEIEVGNYKLQMASAQFDMDRKLVNYKNYVKKLQTKLESLGFIFKDKRNSEYRKRTKTIV
jgi:chromosome segregation ATPase